MHVSKAFLAVTLTAGLSTLATPLSADSSVNSADDTLRLARATTPAPVVDPATFSIARVQDDEAADLPDDVESEWLSEFDINVGGSTGNTETFDLRVAFRTERETERERLRIDASYFYGEADNVKNQSRLTAGIRNDWYIADSPWSFFAQGRYDFTEFREWKHRASAHGGAGYDFVRSEELRVIGRIGAGASKEWKRTDDLTPEGLLGLEADWKISDRQRLIAETTLFPELDDFFEFRWVSSLSWRMELDNLRGIFVTAGLENEYESTTDEGVDHNDLRYYAGLTVAF